MKKSFLFLLLFLWLAALPAQKQNRELASVPAIYILHNGSILKGFVAKKYDDGSVDFIMLGNYAIHIPAEDIKKKRKSDPDKLFFKDGKFFQTKGYYTLVRIGSNWSASNLPGEGGFSGLSIINAHGYQFSHWLSLGGASGLDLYNISNGRSESYLPILIDLRSFPHNGKLSPFIALAGGYGIAVDIFDNYTREDEYYKGGWTVAPAVGIRFATTNSGNFIMEAGYRFQRARSRYNDYRDFPLIVRRDGVLKRLDIAFGWLF